MKKLFTLFIIIILASDVHGQYTSIGHRAETFFDSTRTRSITCDIYYPADVSGTNVSVVSDTIHFPVLVFGHGFVMSTSSYSSLRDSLVLQGYIMALPTTESAIRPSWPIQIRRVRGRRSVGTAVPKFAFRGAETLKFRGLMPHLIPHLLE